MSESKPRLCKDCCHCEHIITKVPCGFLWLRTKTVDRVTEYSKCLHPAAIKAPVPPSDTDQFVTGTASTALPPARDDHYYAAVFRISSPGFCGSEARYFEPADMDEWCDFIMARIVALEAQVKARGE